MKKSFRASRKLISVAALAVVSNFAVSARAGSAPTLNTVASFNSLNGMSPYSQLTSDSLGNLYGTTDFGGASNKGTVFKYVPATQTLSVVASFNGTNGFGPYAGLLTDSAGNMYGTTQEGGASNDGTVFEIPVGTSSIITLATFNGSNGKYPGGKLVMDSSGYLYGTTEGNSGTSGDFGLVFKVKIGSNAVTDIASFNGYNGMNPGAAGLAIDPAGNLYGTTENGGLYYGQGNVQGSGVVYKIAAGTTTITDLVQFNVTNGSHPDSSLLIDRAGNLFGTTGAGGSASTNAGSVFEIPAGTSTLNTLAAFTGTTPSGGPGGTLIEDAAGNLFGTTDFSATGTSTVGGIYELPAGSSTPQFLATFTGSIADQYAAAGLYADSMGNLYGTQVQGGSSSDGSIYELTNSGFIVPEPGCLSLLLAAAAPALAMRRRSPIYPQRKNHPRC